MAREASVKLDHLGNETVEGECVCVAQWVRWAET